MISMTAKYKPIDNEQDKEIMVIRLDMVKLQTDMEYTKLKVDSIDYKLDKFIECVDNKYASKDLEQKVAATDKELQIVKLRIATYIGIASAAVGIITFLINKFL